MKTDEIKKVTRYRDGDVLLKVSYGFSHEKRSTGIRIYVTAPDPEDQGMPGRPPYTSIGEDLANDELWKEYNRNELKLMKEAISVSVNDEEVADMFKEAGFNISDDSVKFVYSRKAGCSCGCSPGFIPKTYLNKKYTPIKCPWASGALSIWIHVTSIQAEAENTVGRLNDLTTRVHDLQDQLTRVDEIVAEEMSAVITRKAAEKTDRLERELTLAVKSIEDNKKTLDQLSAKL